MRSTRFAIVQKYEPELIPFTQVRYKNMEVVFEDDTGEVTVRIERSPQCKPGCPPVAGNLPSPYARDPRRGTMPRMATTSGSEEEAMNASDPLPHNVFRLNGYIYNVNNICFDA